MAEENRRVDTVRLQRMVRAYRESATLMAAVDLELFTKVAHGADTEATLIDALDLEPPNGERIVVACLGLGLLERDGDRLRLAPDVARFLVEGEPTYAGPWMLFTRPDWNEWGRLATHLRRPGPPLDKNISVADISLQEARRYHRATYSVGLGAGRLFARQVDLSQRQRLLDLGGGSGAYCIAACRENPTCAPPYSTFPPSRSWRARSSRRTAFRIESTPSPATSTATRFRPMPMSS